MGFRNFSGILYLQCGECFFPSLDWDDLVVAVLSMWLRITVDHLIGYQEQHELLFMDGDYSVILKRMSKQSSLATFLRDDKYIEYQEEIDILYFVRQLLAAAEIIIVHCPDAKKTRDIYQLADHADRLRNVLKIWRTSDTEASDH